MGTPAEKAQKILKNSGIIEARNESDTLRLWENYREQAHLWRGIALIQIPATCLALIFAFVMWESRSIKLNVPAKPLPGIYEAKEIPDSEFFDFATNFINLVASYQSSTAERQFKKALEMIKEPYLTKFKQDMYETELRTILATNRTQTFFPDPSKTSAERTENGSVKIIMIGERSKWIAGKELQPRTSRFSVTLGINPRNILNPYGIVVTDFTAEDLVK